MLRWAPSLGLGLRPPPPGCWEKTPALPPGTPSPLPIVVFQPLNAPPSLLQGELGGNVHGGRGHRGEACPQGPGPCNHPISRSLWPGRTQEMEVSNSQPGGVSTPRAIHPPPLLGLFPTLSTQDPLHPLFPPVLGPVVRELGWPQPGAGGY